MDAKYTEPTGQLRDLIAKPKKNGEGVDLIALDENNIPWLWSWFDGFWTANMSVEAGQRLGYKVNEGAINNPRQQTSPYRGPGLSNQPAADQAWEDRQPPSNRGRFAER